MNMMKRSDVQRPPTPPPSPVPAAFFLFVLLLNCQSSHGFTYRKSNMQVLAPEMVCIAGVQHKTAAGGSSAVMPCPKTPEEVDAFDAVVMDEHGYVKVTLKDIRMRDDGRQRTHGDAYESSSSTNADGSIRSSSFWTKFFGGRRTIEISGNDHMYDRNDDTSSRWLANKNIQHETDLIPEASTDDILQSATSPHRLQVYLVNLDDYSDIVTKSQCCYELEFGPPFPAWVETEVRNGKERAAMPAECKIKSSDRNRVGDDDRDADIFAHNYRANAPRTGNMQAVSAPVVVNSQPQVDTKKEGGRKKKENKRLGPGIHVVSTLRPKKLGRHMVVISNCAAELESLPPHERHSRILTSADNSTRVRAAGLKAIISEVEVTFASKFGELPLSMSGIIPFYAFLLACYALLTAVWWKRSMAPHPVVGKGKNTNRWGYSSLNIRNAFGGSIGGDFASVSPRPVLGLQGVLRRLIHLQLLFTALAFSYYMHLNRSTVDIHVLYSGTAAALVDQSAWSNAVAMAHFCTILASQVVVTLATDGTWLIQQHIRPSTRKVLYGLSGIWLVFSFFYRFMSPKVRGVLLIVLGFVWVGFLLYNVRRSLRHLQMLLVGQDNDNVIAVGGALVAKRSLYKKLCAVIAIYPLVFLISVIWSTSSQQDSWAWISYVLVDIYLFIMLLHASVIWMPRPMASQEYVKYAPLEMSVTTNNDKEVWDEGIQEAWSQEEVEMSFQ